MFRDMYYAVKSPAEYKEFLTRKKWKIFLYGVLLITIYFLLVNVFPFARFQIIHGGFQTLAERYIPEFELRDGRLYMDDTFHVDQAGMYMDVDTSSVWVENQQQEVMEIMRSRYYSTVLIVDSKTLAMKNDGKIQMIDFKDLSGMNLTKSDIYGYIPMLNIILAVIMVVWYFFDIALFFFGVLILSLLGLIVRAVMKTELTFGQIFIMGVYARTLSIAIKAVLNMFHVGVPFFWMMSMIISVVYLSLAFKHIREEREEQERKAALEADSIANPESETYGGTRSDYEQ
ncbi:DUF1189 domain-containing protein [Clostridium sp. AM58-1XD]|uniref:DUF1189 domain-containing protein n=1 Tax=Clostridium sp. AM58-1XD TaxID=2292307 RepID=UPI000E488E59|nr:DUF1189 domain-containing protein [Clostridium sp. AM58-1XD]RGY98109.1 DUF1189 domain-containing protein [Clostridium sp. AM58-1XD]